MDNYFIIYDTFYPIIEGSLKQNKNLNELKHIFNEIIAKNTESLSSNVPDKAVWVDGRLENKYFNIIGVDRNHVFEILKRSGYIKEEWMTVSNPTYITLVLCTYYFNNRKNNDMLNMTMFILSLYMYKNVRSKYLKRTSENTTKVMNYTLSRLSKHHDLKVCGSIMKVLLKKSETFVNLWLVDSRSHETKNRVSDETICKMINDYSRRYNVLLNGFYREFKQDLVSGNYMNVDEDIDDGENFIESDNVSFTVERLTQKVVNRFILSNNSLQKLIEVASSIGKGSTNNLKTMMSYLYNKHEKEFENIVRLTLQAFLFENRNKKEDVKTHRFVMDMLQYYKKQEAKNSNLMELKTGIDNIFVNSGLPDRVKREASKNDCKRTLYVYILLYIMDTM